MADKKQCRICGEFKDLSLFYIARGNYRKGECSACSSRQRKYWAPPKLGDRRIKYNSDGTKACCECGQVRPHDDFLLKKVVQSKKERRYLAGPCKSCRSKRAKEHGAEWRMKSKYGITLRQYFEMLERQGGGCAICGSNRTKNIARPNQLLSVDHDHETGRVRGILCNECNAGLGYFKNSSIRLRSAAEYLEKVVN